jgi:Fe-S cluster biogenesis protein NfuA
MSNETEPNSDLYQRVAKVIDDVRTYIQADGGDIDLVGVEEDGTVKVRLRGACAGCPHAAVTLKGGIERAVRQKVPEIREVVNVG